MSGLYKPKLDRAPRKGRLDVAAYRIVERVLSEREPLAWQLLQPAAEAIAHQYLGPRTPAGRLAARLVAPKEATACRFKPQAQRKR